MENEPHNDDEQAFETGLDAPYFIERIQESIVDNWSKEDLSCLQTSSVEQRCWCSFFNG